MKKVIIVVAIVLICLYSIPISAQEAVVSKGKTYELVTPASSAYPDTDTKKLTNGIYASPTAVDISDTSTNSGTAQYI